MGWTFGARGITIGGGGGGPGVCEAEEIAGGGGGGGGGGGPFEEPVVTDLRETSGTRTLGDSGMGEAAMLEPTGIGARGGGGGGGGGGGTCEESLRLGVRGTSRVFGGSVD